MIAKHISMPTLALLILAGCSPTNETKSLQEARRGFQTRLTNQVVSGEPVAQPPSELFRVVRYPSQVGELSAYLSPDPQDGKRYPAMIWIFGGFSNGIGDTAWEESTPDNDQSASAFRKAGIVMMYPSLRGGNDNPGLREGFFGEVDDVVAASEFLSRQEFVDPQRIYLGGHSTGGTLVLLVAASSDRFRAVFSFGPVENVGGYPADFLPFDVSDDRELELRAPVRWMHSVQSPVFILEGTEQPTNVECLPILEEASRNAKVHVHVVKGANHFSILAPMTRLIAEKILRDVGPTTNIQFREDELDLSKLR